MAIFTEIYNESKQEKTLCYTIDHEPLYRH